jgi:hypothetical protein
VVKVPDMFSNIYRLNMYILKTSKLKKRQLEEKNNSKAGVEERKKERKNFKF